MLSSQSTRVSEQSPSKQPKAQWNDDNTKVLLEALAEQIMSGNRINGVYNAEGWRNIITKFHQLTDLPYTKNQLKNRSNQLCFIYSKWVKLTDRATGLGCDPSTGTISASDEWWATQAQEDPDVYKWKNSPPKFLDLMYQCYAGTFATGRYAYIPSYVPTASPSNTTQVPLSHAIPDNATVPPRPDQTSAGTDPVQPGQATVGQDPPIHTSGLNGNPHVSSFSPSNKRARGSHPRRSSGVELSASVGEIASILREKHTTMEAAINARDPELEDFDTAYNLLQQQTYLEPASDFHLRAIQVLEHKIRRHAFVNYVSKFPAEAQVKWFKNLF